MVKFIFRFADGDSEREFNSTFEAYCEVLEAYNQCEEYFLGARLATSKKADWINILDAEEYVGQVGPVKEYLEHAAVCGFDEYQIREDIQNMYFMNVPSMFASWKKHMQEYVKELDNFILKCI